MRTRLNVLFLLVLACCAMSSPSFAEQKAGQETVDHILDEVTRLTKAQQAAIEAGSTAPLEEDFGVAEGATGSNAEIQRFMAEIMNNSVRLRNAYMAELESIGWMKALDAERLAADPDLRDSRELLIDGRQVLVKYSRLTKEYLDSTPGGIDLLDMPETEKRNFRAGYEIGLKRGSATRKKLWDLEFDTFDEFEKIFDLLEDNRTQWQIHSGQIVFESQELLDQFNAHLANMQAITQKQFQVQQETVQSLR